MRLSAAREGEGEQSRTPPSSVLHRSTQQPSVGPIVTYSLFLQNAATLARATAPPRGRARASRELIIVAARMHNQHFFGLKSQR